MSSRRVGILVMASAIAAGAAGEELRLSQRVFTNPRQQPRAATQRTTSTTIVGPSEGEQVALPLRVTVQAPAGAEVREYRLECGYWDQSRSAWVHPGLVGDAFTGGQTATIEITAEMLKRFSPAATRWRLRARVTDPPGPWGGWREFMLGSIEPETGVSQAGTSHIHGLDHSSLLRGFTTEQQTLFQKVRFATRATSPSSLFQNWRTFLDSIQDATLTEEALRGLALISLSDPLRGVIADLDNRLGELNRGISKQLLLQEKLREILPKIAEADRTKGLVSTAD